MSNLSETHPDIAKQWHPTKNGDLKPYQFTKGSNVRIWWLCDKKCSEGCLHEWDCTISNRTTGYGCPYCAVPAKIRCIHNSIVSSNEEIFKQWHPTKNIGIDPSKLSPGSHKKIWWLCDIKCPKGCLHEWESDLRTKIKGHGCPHCQNFKICIHRSIVYTDPDVAKQWHPSKNGDLKPEQFSRGCDKKFWWLCENKCLIGDCIHEWEASIDKRCLSERGCPYCCTPRQKICIHSSLAYTDPDIAKQWHPSKNGEFSPEQFTNMSNKSFWWLCENKHEWKAVISHRQKGGCPICRNKSEQKLLTILLEIFPDTIYQFKKDWCRNPDTNKFLPYDFYIPSLNLIIELDGPQHFIQISNWQDPDEITKKDIYKMKSAIQNNISILRILQEELFNKDIEWFNKNIKPHILKYDNPSVNFLCEISSIYQKHKKLCLENDLTVI